MINFSKQSSSGNQSPVIRGDNTSVLYGVRKRLGNEAQTMLRIVSLIPKVASDQGVTNEEVSYSRDVQKKIDERFASFKDQLRAQLKNLQVLYGDVYDEAKANSGLDEFQIKECYNLLRNLSIKTLNEREQNPVESLESLTLHFKNEFAVSDGEDFSEQAIRYFLYRELIECNVFPNIEESWITNNY